MTALIGRQIFRSLPGRDHLEAAGPRPVDQLAGQRRLIAVSERIDHALGPRFLGQQRTSEDIGLDIDHDDMLARRDRRAGMSDARRRAAGRLYDDLNFRIGTGLRAGRDEPGPPDSCRIPADRATGRARPLGIQIGDHGDLNIRHSRDLIEEHRAEFAGTDQPDTHRFPGALLRQAMEAHSAAALYNRV